MTRITLQQVVNSAMGSREVTRTGTLTGLVSEAGMLRVEWDADPMAPDYIGRWGWVAPGEYTLLDDDRDQVVTVTLGEVDDEYTFTATPQVMSGARYVTLRIEDADGAYQSMRMPLTDFQRVTALWVD